MAALEQVPKGFLDGCVTPDPTHPKSVRHITVLDAIYRILATILAVWYADTLSALVTPVQAACLPALLIADTIITAQLLPAALLLQWELAQPKMVWLRLNARIV